MHQDVLTASRRLINLGEEVQFTICADPVAEFHIFPRYLETCDPQAARTREGRLEWLDGLASEQFALELADGQGVVAYRPPLPGNYLARLRTPERTTYCYFAVVTSEYLVYRMLAYNNLLPMRSAPEMRNGGIPIDWALQPEALPAIIDPTDGLLSTLLEYQDVFGDVIMPWVGSGWAVHRDPALDFEAYMDEAMEQMRGVGLGVGRAVVDWMAFPAAVEHYRRRGFEIVDGIIAEGEPHRGAPWFPYWMSPEDLLSPAEGPSEMMGMIMDFCAGFRFHGPPDFHMLASECNWGVAAPHAEVAAREHTLIAHNSGSGPVFVPTLLTFGYHPWGLWPARDWPEEQQLAFGRDFVDDTAFVHAHKYPIVFARCTDIADYLRDHPAPQPRRVFSSLTHDWPYDRVWSPEWCNLGIDVHREALPVHDSLADIRQRRPAIWAKPTARELIYYEDERSQCRFEYACLKPLLWYTYDDHRPRPPFTNLGLGVKADDAPGDTVVPQGRYEMEIPDPDIVVTTRCEANCYEVSYHITGGALFPDYKLAVWDIPREFAEATVQTDAREFIAVRNADGDFHGILVFGLAAETTVNLTFVR